MAQAKSIKKQVFKLLFLAYTLYLLYLTLLGRSGFFTNLRLFLSVQLSYQGLRLNLVPFKTIGDFFRYGSPLLVMLNVWGNVLAFAPFAFFAPLLRRQLRSFFRFFFFISLIVLLVELLQGVFMVGSVDIDDYILNVSGAMLLFLILWKTPLRKPLDKLI